MLLRYHPEGQDTATVWEFKLEKLRSAEVEALEKRTGFDFGTDFRERLLKGNMLARRALLWTFQRRAHPFIKFDDVDFADGEVTIELDAGELVDRRAEVVKLVESGVVDAEDAEIALTMIDAQIAEWREQHPDEGDEQGKAVTLTFVTDTGSPLPS